MAYSAAQAQRVRALLAGHKGVTEKEMFGGIAFLLHGNMCVGVAGEDLMVRCEPAQTEALLREPGAKPFTLSGRAGMAGWLVVGPAGTKTPAALKAWVGRGVAYAGALRKKAPKAAKAGARAKPGGNRGPGSSRS